MIKFVNEKLERNEELLAKSQEGIMRKKDVEAMIEPKASKIQQTELRQAINTLNIELAPLIEKGHTLSNFIDSVNAEAEKELKLDSFSQRLEQQQTKMKTMSENFEKDFDSLSERISSMEQSIIAFKEELIQAQKPKANRGGGFDMMDSLQKSVPEPQTAM